MIRSGIELEVVTTLKGNMARLAEAHAKRLNRRPVDLLADIIERVFLDNLVDAILDEN